MTPVPRVVHGDDLLYRFFSNLLRDADTRYSGVPQLLLEATAVWLPPDTYSRWPILLPWVVRDPSCRGRPSQGIPDQWGSPDQRGYLRDDNSLIKSLPRALPIAGPLQSGLSGARLGTEFVAAHVWRHVKGSDVLASRWPELNSFVPNLVWLPAQIAKLTDREGSGVQETLQVMSRDIYRNAPVEDHLADIVTRAWRLLPIPRRAIRPLDHSNLNWFRPSERFYQTRGTRLRSVLEALSAIEKGLALETKVITTRYGAGLPQVPKATIRELRVYLDRFDPGNDHADDETLRAGSETGNERVDEDGDRRMGP